MMNAFCSMRNIPTMMMLTADGINVYDIVNANKIVFIHARCMMMASNIAC